jgi:hypothetical protein
MIIEPVPTTPRDPLRRLRGLLGFLVPPALLVGVIAVALAGGPDDEASADPSLVLQPTGAPEAVAVPTPRPQVRGDEAAFPEQILGLPVLTPSEADATRVEGIPGPPLMVAGYLSIRGVREDCVDRVVGPQGSFCHRSAVLAEAPLSPYGGNGLWRGIGRHLHPEFPPGVRWPIGVTNTTPDRGGPPFPVVILGRFGDPRAMPCAVDAFECTEGFVAERIVWANGDSYARTTTVDAAVDIDLSEDPWRERRNAARANLTDITLIAMSALLAPDTLARVDPSAADALAAGAVGGAVAGPVWYVRGMDLRPAQDGEPSGVVRWVVVDDLGGQVLASSEADQAR